MLTTPHGRSTTTRTALALHAPSKPLTWVARATHGAVLPYRRAAALRGPVRNFALQGNAVHIPRRARRVDAFCQRFVICVDPATTGWAPERSGPRTAPPHSLSPRLGKITVRRECCTTAKHVRIERARDELRSAPRGLGREAAGAARSWSGLSNTRPAPS